jgi:putative RecB family exonuclease
VTQPTAAANQPAEPLGQGELPGMPRRLYSASPSKLLAWVDCPRRYRFQYLDRPRPATAPQRAHTSLGVAVHSALARWWDLEVTRRTPSAAAGLVRAAWVRSGFRDDEQSERWKAKAAVQTASYAERLDPETQPLGIERTVALRTDTTVLNGRVDRLDDRDGELVIVDYKTSRVAPGADEARTSLALGFYASAVGAMFRRACRRVELHHVPTGTVVGHEHSPESLARKVAEAESIAADLVRADAAFASGWPAAELDAVFAPRTGPICGWCDFRAHCPEGQATAPVKSGWAALEPELPA